MKYMMRILIRQKSTRQKLKRAVGKQRMLEPIGSVSRITDIPPGKSGIRFEDSICLDHLIFRRSNTSMLANIS